MTAAILWSITYAVAAISAIAARYAVSRLQAGGNV